ncbi:hypothetical protein BDE36_1684 [Arcticibacter tournemirensis]|uniref:Tetratricopeptide repeat protein n=1 Tax=Arcticibacter tournemirensis TaxID=699437 RepID=A0A5M9HE01_9SPHI|nr:hypothetical protein [Arcticibacter tournemirensis]KAA8483831.1 tetratricopeptide repeat protein [Arcticibacter tournemirensis]TQM49953.1 hypothetical protein BDE36_1684 [Arcticibacter tournemirensis]
MRNYYLFIVTFFLFIHTCFSQKLNRPDSLEIARLNRLGYEARLTDPELTIDYGTKAFDLASKFDYKDGIAESYRVIGIGNYYLGKNDIAISQYLKSLTLFKETKNLNGQAKVYNNIGNLYREVDYEKGLQFFREALILARHLNIPDLIAGCYLNTGIIYYRKKQYNIALKNFEQSYILFQKLNNPIGITQSLQNRGVIYFKLNQISKAEELLLEANKKAKENELNNTIASTNLTLTSVYIQQNKFEKAEETRDEGLAYARLVKDNKLEQDYNYTSYELENKRKRYQQALYYLREVYKIDSMSFRSQVSEKIGLLQEQYTYREKERENQLIIERQKTSKILYWATTIVLILSIVVIILLVMSVRKKSKTNKQLQALNDEISLQKENLDRINHNLEEIIADRTKDLQIKNKKLSAYSSHLSHQIRSPIATMKGLMLLEQENLIEEEEFVKEIGKCVNEIDDKILNINETLHNPEDQGF